jgi:hypothetical protein
MIIQLNILQAIEEKNKGIDQSINHANEVIDNWSERAYGILLKFLSVHRGTFMAEEVRSYAELMDFPLPPSARSWGSVFVRASKNGLIEGRGYGLVRNIKAHRTPARVWIQVKQTA